jgi:hypothetical protein
MLADEYILVFCSLSSPVWAEQLLSAFSINSTSVFQSASVPADVTQNTSTAESPNVVGNQKQNLFSIHGWQTL